jgi:tryptophan synthase beta chain
MNNKINLPDTEMPTSWYNVLPELLDLKTPFSPPLHPGTHKPLEPQMLAPLFPMALIEQEADIKNKTIPIPQEVIDILRLWRPTPMHRALALEKALKTPAKIYFKNESVSPPGSHKSNTSVPQVYYNMKEGIKRISTETGAGQWGSALAFACSLFGIEAVVYMVRVSFEQKPFRKALMHVWGATCHASPTDMTEAGRDMLKRDPSCPGSLGLAISEAVEDAAGREDTHYALGSVLNHVLLHQTIIGEEVKKQLSLEGIKPDILIGCVGGGSNFGGLVLPFVPNVKAGEKIRMIGVEPAACPTLTRGLYAYDFGDEAKLTPLMKMYTLGHKFMPPKIHSGGLRYHGDSPIVSQLCKEGIVEGRAYHQKEVFDAAVLFAKTEGFLPAPETSHAIKAAIDEAVKCRESCEAKTIIFNYSGHGHFDLTSYMNYMEGEIEDYSLPQKEIDEAATYIPKV